MPVTLNGSAGTQATAVATSVAFAGLTIGAIVNTILLMAISWKSTPGAITVKNWDNGGGSPQALTLIQSATALSVDAQVTHIYGLVAPITGNKTLQMTWTNSIEYVINAVAFDGAHQGGGSTTFPGSVTATGTADPANNTVVLPAGGAVAGSLVCGSSFAINTISATQFYLLHGVGAIEAGGSYSFASGAFSYDLTGGDQWGFVGTGIAPAPSGGVFRKQARPFPFKPGGSTIRRF